METKNETVMEINDAKLEAMRACLQFPNNAHFAEEISAFRAMAKRALWSHIELVNFKFSVD